MWLELEVIGTKDSDLSYTLKDLSMSRIEFIELFSCNLSQTWYLPVVYPLVWSPNSMDEPFSINLCCFPVLFVAVAMWQKC